MLKDAWEHHDNLMRSTPARTVEWGISSARQEVEEWQQTTPEDPEAFLREGADVILSYMTTMKAAGFSYEVAIGAVMEKLNIVIDRALQAGNPNSEGWYERYEIAKASEVDVFVG